MRRREMVLSAALMVAAAGATAAAEVERYAPISAMAAVRFRAVDQSIKSVTEMMGKDRAGITPAALYAQLGEQVANTPVGPFVPGFDPAGEMMLVVLNPKVYAESTVLVVPVKDYRAYLAAMLRGPGSRQVKDESGLDVIASQERELDEEAMAAARERGDWEPKYRTVTVRRYVADAGKWAIVAAHRDACLAVAAQKKDDAKSLFSLAGPHQVKGLDAKNILLVAGVQNLIEGLSDQIEDLKKGKIPGMPAMPGMPGMPGMPVPGLPPTMKSQAFTGLPGAGGPTGGPADMLKELGQQVDQALALAGEFQLLAVGFDSTDQGATVTTWATPRAGGRLADLNFPEPAGTPDLAKLLPKEAAMAVAVALDPKSIEALAAVLTKLATPGMAELKEEERARIAALTRKQLGAMGHAMAFAVWQGKPGTAAIDFQEIVAVKDAATVREAVEESLALTSGGVGVPQTRGVKTSVKHEENVRTYKGYTINRATVTVEATDPASQKAQMFKSLYPDGLAIEYAVGTGQLLSAAGGEKPLDRLIDAVAAGSGGLRETEAYAQAMAGLPAKRDGEYYLSGKKVLALFISQMDRMTAAPGAPPGMPGMGSLLFGPMLAGLTSDLPVGMSLLAKEGRVDVFVPAPTLKALAEMGAGAMMPMPGMGLPAPQPMPAPAP